MHVTSKISIKRLDGERWFRRKPQMEIRTCSDEWYGGKSEPRVQLWIRISGLEVSFDLDPEEVQRAMDYARNKR